MFICSGLSVSMFVLRCILCDGVREAAALIDIHTIQTVTSVYCFVMFGVSYILVEVASKIDFEFIEDYLPSLKFFLYS